VKWGATPKDYFEDRRDFMDNPDSYSQQLLRKVTWVKENATAVFEGMKSVLSLSEDTKPPSKIVYAMVTFYPTPISVLIQDFPCTSFPKFFDVIDASQDWPFEVGVDNLPVSVVSS